jgi:hypothetical protein
MLQKLKFTDSGEGCLAGPLTAGQQSAQAVRTEFSLKIQGVFRCKKILNFVTLALSFVFGN